VIDIKEENKNREIENNNLLEIWGAFSLATLIFGIFLFFTIYVVSDIFSGI